MLQPVNLTSRTNSVGIVHDVMPQQCRNPTKKLKDGSIVDLPKMYLYCVDCGRRKLINPSCGRRNCPKCGLKRALKLETRYLDAILQKRNERAHMWTFVNLTGVKVRVDKDTLASDLRRFANCMEKFLSEEYEEAGLAVVEHTTTYQTEKVADIETAGDFVVQWGSYVDSVQFVGPATVITYEVSLYVHGHAIVYGGYKTKAPFEERWGRALVKAGLLSHADFVKERQNAIEKHSGVGYERVEGLRYVGIEAVRNPKRSVRYILKYVAKGVDLSDEYLEVLKRLKYVRTWGFLYGMKEPSYDLICDDCGGKCYIGFDEEQIIEYYGNNSAPLKVKRVLRVEIPP